MIEKLDYLVELGINAVELMPVKEFPGKSWGYNLRSLFAVDSSYGSPSDLCRLVDECHGRGIRVIMDGVYNHAEADAPLAKIDYEYWFYRENPDPECMHWGPKFNYTHYDENLKVFPARKYVIESIEFWMEHFHIDGIRFDATAAIKDFNIMREFTDAAFKKIDGRKPFFTVAEHIPEDPAIVGYPDRGPMVALWHESFAKQLQAVATRHERDGADPWDLDALEQKMNPATNGMGSRVSAREAGDGAAAHITGSADDLDGAGIWGGESEIARPAADRLGAAGEQNQQRSSAIHRGAGEDAITQPRALLR